MTQTTEVHGADRVAATMAHAARDLGRMDTANQRIAMALAQKSRGAAPKRSGALSRSTVGRAGANNSAEITATVVYAGVIHNGWARHHIRANPFIMRTVEATQGQWVGAYTEEVQTICDQVRGV